MSTNKIIVMAGAILLSVTQISVMAQLATAEKTTMMENKSMGKWELLGTRVVDYTIDHDMISLDSTMQPYTAIKIRVKEGQVNVQKSTVHFANGDTQNMDLPEVLTKANDGKVIDLKGDKRMIDKITFWYDTKEKPDQKSVVEVWGMK